MQVMARTIGTIATALALCLAGGCLSRGIEDVHILNDDAVYRFGANTVVEKVLYQTDDGEWIEYPKPVLFPMGFYIGKGPED